MNQRRQLCTFYLQELLFGVEVEKVQEVIRYQEMTRIPAVAGGDCRADQSARPDRYCHRSPAPAAHWLPAMAASCP